MYVAMLQVLVLSACESITLLVSPLDGIEWVLTEFDGGVAAPDEPVVTLVFDDGRVSGSAGCNRYTAGFTLGPSSDGMTIGPIASTRKMCAPDTMDVEQRYLEALEQVGSYEITADGGLQLSSRPDGTPGALAFARGDESPDAAPVRSIPLPGAAALPGAGALP